MFKNIRNLRIRIRDTVHNIIKIQITRQKSKMKDPDPKYWVTDCTGTSTTSFTSLCIVGTVPEKDEDPGSADVFY